MQFLVLNKSDQIHKFAEYKVNIQNQLNVYIPATNNKKCLNDKIYHQIISIPKKKPHEGVIFLPKNLIKNIERQ